MVKHAILLVLISTAAIFFKTQVAQGLQGLLYLHNEVARGLGIVFSADNTGRVIQAILALIAIPVIAGVIAALVFRLVKHTTMPHTKATIWIVWTVLLVTMLAQQV